MAAPSSPIVGVVRDQDTKKPLAGVTIRSNSRAINSSYFRHLDFAVQATTDADGRYRLTGMPKGKGYHILIVPASDQPYVVSKREVPDSAGLEPVTVDVTLKRGVWIEGKITDKVTGKPLQGSVEYFSFYTNPNRPDYPGLELTGFHIIPAKADGTYRVAGLPGPGLVAVYYQKGPYLRANERDDEFGTRERSLNTTPYAILFPSNYSALARIDPARGADKVKRDVTLDPGWAFQGTVLGPDGKPLAGGRRFDPNSRHSWDSALMKTAEFTGWFNPRHPYDVLFRHPEKGLVGVAKPPKENGGRVTVRLQPGATLSGRLVDAVGKPRAGVELEVTFRPKPWQAWYAYPPERIRTDRDGRFRLEALLPGYEFRLAAGEGELLLGAAPRSDDTKDLGDVRMKEVKQGEE